MAGHYYGDETRRIFIAVGVIMLVTYPFVYAHIPFSYAVTIAAVVLLGIFAGFTNPLQQWVHIFNLVIATFAFVMFEYSAVGAFQTAPFSFFFFDNQILAVLSFFAIYFSGKTIRGLLLWGINRGE